MRKFIFSIFSWTGQQEQEEGDEAVEEEYLETEGIAKPSRREKTDNVAENGRENGNPGHPAVLDLAFGEEAEGIETQQRTIGKACNIEDNVDERVIMERPEGDDYQ